MRKTLFLLVLLFCFAARPAISQEPGIAPTWEVRQIIEQAARQVSLLANVVEQIHAARWPASAQSDRESFHTVSEQIGGLEQNLAELKAHPEHLSVLLEAVARLDTIVRQLDALRPDVARYQDPGLAIDLDRLLAGPSASREKLFRHASDLARFLEEQNRALERDIAQCEQTRRERQRLAPSPRSRKR